MEMHEINKKKIQDQLLSSYKTPEDIQREQNLVKAALGLEPVKLQEDVIKKSNSLGLVKKIVDVKLKNGQVHKAVRWVSPDSGQSKVLQHPKYIKPIVEHSDEDQSVQEVVHSELGNTAKCRALISLGIYDKTQLMDLVGNGMSGYDVLALVKQAGIEVDEFKEAQLSVNTNLPILPSPGAVDLSDPAQQVMAVADYVDLHGTKSGFDYQKSLKKLVMEKYGLTTEDKWEGYENDLDMFFEGTLGLKAVMGYGSGGVGKSYVLENVVIPKHKKIEYDPELDMDKNGDEYDYVRISGKIGSKETQRYMYEHRNKVLIFDDCDSMWRDEGLINVLKATLDTSGKGKCQWAMRLPETSKGADDEVPASFTFSGRMIFITNLTKQELVSEGAGPIVESRTASTDLTMNLKQTMEHLSRISHKLEIKDESGEYMKDLVDQDKQMAFNAFSEASPYGRIEQVNTRVLTGMIAKARVERLKGTTPEDVQKFLVKQVLKQFGF